MSKFNSVLDIRSAYREVVILEVGILIAFGLDAGWEKWAQRAEIRSDLHSVLTELQDNRDLVDVYITNHGRAESATAIFLGLLQANTSDQVEIPDSIIWGTQFTPTFDPGTGALDALLGSGKIALIADGSLRAALAGFGADLADASESETRSRDYYDLQVAGVLHRSGDVTRAVSSYEWFDQGGPSGGSNFYTTVNPSVELMNHLSRRELLEFLSVSSSTVVREELELLVELIQTTLGD